VTLEAWKKPTKKKGKGKDHRHRRSATPPLAEKIFYGYKTEVSRSATLIGYAFIDGEWAYTAFPAEGLPSCTAATGDGAKEGAEGCVKYSYEPTTGVVTIGSVTGKLNPAANSKSTARRTPRRRSPQPTRGSRSNRNTSATRPLWADRRLHDLARTPDPRQQTANSCSRANR